MVQDLIILDELNGQEAAVLLRSNRIEDCFFSLVNKKFLTPGNIYNGLIDRTVKGQGGAFIKLPNNKTGFLRNSKGLKLGKKILVQVTGYPEEGKAIPLSNKIMLKGRTVIVTPFAKGVNFSRQIKLDHEKLRILDVLNSIFSDDIDFGIIVRSIATQICSEEIQNEAKSYINIAQKILSDEEKKPTLLVQGSTPHELALREWRDSDDIKVISNGFEDYGILDKLDSLLNPKVEAGLGAVFIEPTRAVVAVDVNTGKDFSVTSGLKANLNLARMLPRQLRLRGLGGQIVLDLAPMPKRDRKLFEINLKKAFKADPVDTTLVGWTPLGHYEIQRKRERVSLESVLKP